MSVIFRSIDMNILAKLGGLEEALTTLGTIKQKSHVGQLKALEQVAILLRDGAVRYLGAGHPDHPEVQSGRLKASIQYVIADGAQVTGAVGSNMDAYASSVEFGHSQTPGRFVPELGKRLVASRVKAYPFLRPAMDDVVESGKGVSVYGETIKKEVFS